MNKKIGYVNVLSKLLKFVCREESRVYINIFDVIRILMMIVYIGRKNFVISIMGFVMGCMISCDN